MDQYRSFITSRQKLERDKGLEIIKEILKAPKDGETASLETNILELLVEREGLESILGALCASILMLEAGVGSDEFCKNVQKAVPDFLEHDEPRVRISAGEVMGHLCHHCGPQVYSDLQDVLTYGIRTNMERDCDTQSEPGDLKDTVVSRDGRSLSPISALILHDTAGWKTLETYMIALQKAVVGCGTKFAPFVNADLVQLIFTSLSHTNRFVRETGYKTLAVIVKCPALPEAVVSSLWPSVADHLATGLADNWSQVRMAASVATREFLTDEGQVSGGAASSSPNTPGRGQAYLPVLLPPMCLNRYYVAEGVKLYSQETWRRVTGGRGVVLVEENISRVVEFYISQSMAANHAVREAACTCIAELGTKVSRDCLRPHVNRLITVLLECFKDDSWPVRDAACLASGNFVSCFPDECRSMLEDLYPLFLANLEDSIPSVRQGAAVALGQVYTAYGSEIEGRLFSTLQERLPQVSDQPSDAPSPIDPAPATFGVVQRADTDVAHTNQQMYSCGSLAPKMKRGGCMDSAFHRPAQPWERSEGCVHLLAVLSQQPALSGRVESLLPVLAESARVRHYPQYLNYLETVLKQLPVISKSLGKRIFKRHLEGFLDPIFHALSCDSALVKTAAGQCLNMLTQQIGRMIMRGRIEQQNSLWADVFDRTLMM